MRDIKPATLEAIESLKGKSGDELNDAVDYIVNALKASSCTIQVETRSDDYSPVPSYDPETDGDYSAWLVSNNID